MNMGQRAGICELYRVEGILLGGSSLLMAFLRCSISAMNLGDGASVERLFDTAAGWVGLGHESVFFSGAAVYCIYEVYDMCSRRVNKRVVIRILHTDPRVMMVWIGQDSRMGLYWKIQRT